MGLPQCVTIKKWRNNRGLSVAWKESVEVKEFILGVFGDEELRNLKKWTDIKICEDNENVESLQFTNFDYLRICDKRYRGVDLPLSKKPE